MKLTAAATVTSGIGKPRIRLLMHPAPRSSRRAARQLPNATRAASQTPPGTTTTRVKELLWDISNK